MKTLVVYYSRSGNSKKVAEGISNALKCDIEKIIDTNARSGILGFLFAGRDSMRGNLTKIKPIEKKISEYDLIIVGGPVWAGNICIPVRTFLSDHGSEIKNAAFFCTEGGRGAENAFKTMASILGKEPISTLAIKQMEMKRDQHLQKLTVFVDILRASR